MALSYVDYLLMKQLNISATVDMSIIQNKYTNNDINTAVIKETYIVKHQEIHRIFDKIKIPQIQLQNRWLYINGQLALINDNTIDAPAVEKLIFYEVSAKILWLQVLINNQHTDECTISLIECQNMQNLFISSTNKKFHYECNRTFAEDILHSLHIRWKKYLERVYLSLMDLYTAINSTNNLLI